MDKVEAKLLLQAYRPNGADAGHAQFAEALAAVERDPELRAWWVAQQEFDRRVAAKMEQFTLPPDLRATILAGGKIEQRSLRSRFAARLAIAALFAILAVLGDVFFFQNADAQKLTASEYDSSAIAFLGNDEPSLGILSSDHSRVLSWLQEQKAPTGAIPGKMTSLPSVGCQKFTVHGHAVSLICFAVEGNKIVHLFMVDRNALQDIPPLGSPQFAQLGSWSTAAWSDDAHSYLMVTEAGPEVLKHLL